MSSMPLWVPDNADKEISRKSTNNEVLFAVSKSDNLRVRTHFCTRLINFRCVCLCDQGTPNLGRQIICTEANCKYRFHTPFALHVSSIFWNRRSLALLWRICGNAVTSLMVSVLIFNELSLHLSLISDYARARL